MLCYNLFIPNHKIPKNMIFIGLDAGSVSVKVVLLDENGSRLYSSYKRHRGQPLSVALESETLHSSLLTIYNRLRRKADW